MTTAPALTTPTAADHAAEDELRLPGLADALAGIRSEAADHDRDATFPFRAFDALFQVGAMGFTVPSDVGGAGRGLADTARLIRAIARADASVALVLAMHVKLHAGIRWPGSSWTPALRALLQRSAVDDGGLVNTVQVEREQGSLARGGSPATTARVQPGGFVVTGHKVYGTGAPLLRWFVVGATTDEATPQVGSFVVEAGSPGLAIDPTWDHIGMRASGSHDVILDEVFVPADRVFALRPRGERAGSFDAVVRPWSAVVLAALYTGIAEAARDWLVGYLHERVPTNLGAPLASLPRFHEAVGEIEALLLASDRLITDAAARVDAAERDGTIEAVDAPAIDLVKYLATQHATRAVEIGLRSIGNPGLTRANPIERLFRDVQCGPVHNPQDDLILQGAGRAALGRDARSA